MSALATLLPHHGPGCSAYPEGALPDVDSKVLPPDPAPSPRDREASVESFVTFTCSLSSFVLARAMNPGIAASASSAMRTCTATTGFRKEHVTMQCTIQHETGPLYEHDIISCFAEAIRTWKCASQIWASKTRQLARVCSRAKARSHS
jgi:hypothetical protein